MNHYPDRRFVRLHLPVEQHPSATVTITAAEPGVKPDSGNHDVLARVAAANPARARMLAARLKVLIGREAEVFAWMEKDPRNSALFLRDPAYALRAALPDLEPDFFTGWGSQEK